MDAGCIYISDDSDNELPDLFSRAKKILSDQDEVISSHLEKKSSHGILQHSSENDEHIEDITIINPPAPATKKIAPKQKKNLQESSAKGQTTIEKICAKIDRRLLEMKEGSEIINRLHSSNNLYEICEQTVNCSITFWQQSKNCFSDEAMVLIPVEYLLSLIATHVLVKQCHQWKTCLNVTNLCLIVVGLESYYRIEKNKSQKEFKQKVLSKRGDDVRTVPNKSTSCTRVDVEEAFIACHIEENVNYRLVDEPSDFADFLCQTMKSLSERSHKLEKVIEGFGFYAEANSTGAVKVDKSGIGLHRLWLQQLRQFTNVGIETTQAIASHYPSPSALVEAYNNLDYNEGSLLLSEIQVRRGVRQLSNTRKIGPELSSKIYEFFSLDQPVHILGQK